MNVIHPSSFTGKKSWDALDIEKFDAATVRLHWADEPYKWHVNDGPEVFVVLHGLVHMHVREKGFEKIHVLEAGDIFHAAAGDEHIAHPQMPSRILVIERPGSV